jgi:hypothetical protein
VETTASHFSTSIIDQNLKLFKDFINKNTSHIKNGEYGGFDIAHTDITDFLEKYQGHPYSTLTQSKPLCQFIDQIAQLGKNSWDVVVISKNNGTYVSDFCEPFRGLNCRIQERTSYMYESSTKPYVEFGCNKRVGSSSNELWGVGKLAIENAKSDYLEYLEFQLAGLRTTDIEQKEKLQKNINMIKSGDSERYSKIIPSRFLRKYRERPLLILHFVQPKNNSDRDKTKKVSASKEKKLNSGMKEFYTNDVFALLGISFPKVEGVVDPVKYMVNPVFIKERNMDEDDSKGDVDDEQ